MKHLISAIIASCCLIFMLPQAQAQAKPAKTKATQAAKERLVLMPLRVPEEDKNLLGAMETALVQGLQQKYEVLSGEQVAKKAREIFLKESRNTAKKECDETRCLQGIAEAFQAELLATANVTKRDGGYFLALSIQNIFDNKVVYSNSVPCKNCDSFQVVEKLKELSGAPTPASSLAAEAINATDPETVLWTEVQKGNTKDDYEVYLAQYPRGKYAALAKSSIKKLKDEAEAELVRQDQSAWDIANGSGSSISDYESYLQNYPKGLYAKLAQARIDKLKKIECVFPNSNKEAPLWVCDASPVEGMAIGAVGSAAKSEFGADTMKKEAVKDAREQLAQMVKMQIDTVLMQKDLIPVPFEEYAAPGSAVIKHISDRILQDSKIFRNVIGPDGTMYVLVGLDQAASDKLTEASMKESLQAVREEQARRQKTQAGGGSNGLTKNSEAAQQIELDKLVALASAYVQDYHKDHPISENQLKQEYDGIKVQLGDKEYNVSHILVATEGEAKEIISQLERGARFEKLAEKSKDSGSAAKGGLLEWAVPSNFVAPFSNAFLKLKKGERTSEPVQTKFGWHVIMLNDMRDLKVPPFDEVKAKLLTRLQQQSVRKLINDLRAKSKIEIVASSEIAALVNDDAIPRAFVDLRAKAAAAEGKADSPELRKAILDDLINLKLLAQARVQYQPGKSTQRPANDCVFPLSSDPAPGWVCDEPVEGYELTTVGSTPIIAGGHPAAKLPPFQDALLDATVSLAQQMTSKRRDMIKQYTETTVPKSKAVDGVPTSTTKQIASIKIGSGIKVASMIKQYVEGADSSNPKNKVNTSVSKLEMDHPCVYVMKNYVETAGTGKNETWDRSSDEEGKQCTIKDVLNEFSSAGLNVVDTVKGPHGELYLLLGAKKISELKITY